MFLFSRTFGKQGGYFSETYNFII